MKYKLEKHESEVTAAVKLAMAAYDVTPEKLEEAGMRGMYQLFDACCRCWSYDDTHPGFAGGHWRRFLPYDGRFYCWFYADGGHDTHLATLLRNVMAIVTKKGE